MPAALQDLALDEPVEVVAMGPALAGAALGQGPVFALDELQRRVWREARGRLARK